MNQTARPARAPRSSSARAAWLMCAVSTTGLWAGCGSEADSGIEAGGVKDSDSAVIVGSVDWQEAAALPANSAQRQNANAVAYLNIPTLGQRCTGFLIAPDVVMTNHHCIPQAQAAQGVVASFGYEAGSQNLRQFTCDQFIGNDRALDMALLGCAGRPGDSLGVVGLSEATVVRNADIYTLHQNCDYYANPSCAPFKKYSGGRITQTGNELGHNADTLGGSSGAPVFSSSHVVIGLHHAGSATSGNGRGSINWAVPMSRIVPVLRQRYPGLQLGARAPVGAPSGPSQGDVDADEGDGYEPNNTLGGATAVTKGFTSSGARIDSGDVDVFAIQHAGGALTLTTTFTHAVGDLDLYVLNQSGAEVGRSIGTTGTERVAGTYPAGRLHIRVVGYQNATGAYTLTVR